MSSNYETYLGFSHDILGNIARRVCDELKECPKHGCGMAWFYRGSWSVKKDEKPLWSSMEIRKLINWTRTTAMIVHARTSVYPEYSLQGPKTENSHPFVGELLGFKWVFAHNGHIRFDRTYVRVRPQDKTLEYRGQVIPLTSYGIDSEVFFRILLFELKEYGGEEPRNVIDVLDHILKSGLISEFHAINFLMGSHRYIYALRYYNEEYSEYEQKYTLYYLMRTGKSVVGRLLRMKLDGVAMFISSEPITSGGWLEEVRKYRDNFPEEKWSQLKNREILYVRIGRPQEYGVEKIG